jgi:hypothetical protein
MSWTWGGATANPGDKDIAGVCFYPIALPPSLRLLLVRSVVRNHARHPRLNRGIKEGIIQIVRTLRARIVNNDLRRHRADRVPPGHGKPKIAYPSREASHDAPIKLQA